MRKLLLPAAIAAVIAYPVLAHAAPTFYTDLAAYTAAAPGATAVDLGALAQGIHGNGLSVPGVTFSTVNPGSPSSALIVYGSLIGNDWFGDTLVLTFAPGTGALGLNVVSQIDEPGSTPVSAPITETAYSGATKLGSTTVTEPSGFFGIVSTTPITKITLFSECDSDCSTNVSDLSLAGAAAGTGGSGTGVAEPSSIAIMLTAIAGAALLALRRRPKLPGLTDAALSARRGRSPPA